MGLGRPFPVGPPTPTSEHRGSSGGDGATRLEPGAGDAGHAGRAGQAAPGELRVVPLLAFPAEALPVKGELGVGPETAETALQNSGMGTEQASR